MRFDIWPRLWRLDIISLAALNPITEYPELEFENTKLKFTDAAVCAIAEKATLRKTGARGLRAVLEETMLNIMFDLPSQPEVEEVIINDEVVLNGEKPMLVYENKKQAS